MVAPDMVIVMMAVDDDPWLSAVLIDYELLEIPGSLRRQESIKDDDLSAEVNQTRVADRCAAILGDGNDTPRLDSPARYVDHVHAPVAQHFVPALVVDLPDEIEGKNDMV